MAAKKTTKKKTKRKPESGCERFVRVAGVQMRRCCIPTAVAITTSVVLSKIGAPIVPIALIGAGGYAWWRGYRVKVVKPDEK
jgi:hypothetical protein